MIERRSACALDPNRFRHEAWPRPRRRSASQCYGSLLLASLLFSLDTVVDGLGQGCIEDEAQAHSTRIVRANGLPRLVILPLRSVFTGLELSRY